MANPQSSSNKKQLTFRFRKDPSYRVVAANGVWGGITPRGDLKLDFFVESGDAPDSVVSVVEGQELSEVSREPVKQRLVRELQIGILLEVDNAESIANFILSKVQPFKVAKEALMTKPAQTPEKAGETAKETQS